jgi:trigger factor
VTTPAKPELEVEVESKELDGGQVELAVRVLPEFVQKARAQVVRVVSRGANIPGFRKGKAPKALLERFLDQDFVKEQIIESMLGDAYDAAVEKAELQVLSRPEIEDAEIGEDGALTFTVTVTRRPEITLGEYKGLKVTRYSTPVTEEQVQAELDRVRGRLAQYADLPEGDSLAKGDLAVVDYEMKVDGETREQGGATGYPLEVGADELFPQLNDALPGLKPGESRDFDVTYPESHTDTELAGKTATFTVTVQQARRRQLPPLDDEFAKKVSDLPTMEELRARVQRNLETIGANIADDDVQSQLIRQVSEGAALDVPESLVQREVERRIAEIDAQLSRRSDSLYENLQRQGRSYEDWRADLESEARQEVRQALVMDEIGNREEIKVSNDEIHEEIHERAEREKVDAHVLAEKLENDSGELNHLVNHIFHRKVIKLLVDNAEVTEEAVLPTSDEAGDAPAPEAEA